MARDAKIAVLWTGWSGYMDACTRALHETLNAEVRVYYFKNSSAAPYEVRDFFRYAQHAEAWDPTQEFEFSDQVRAFAPDLMLVCSWHVSPYRKLALEFRGKCIRVLCMDNQWLGTLRQRIGAAIAPCYIKPYFDCAFVPGSRQAEFARRLGFDKGEVFEGHYSCDYGHFARQHQTRTERHLNRKFCFVGRLVPAKGVEVLRAAWCSLLDKGLDWSLLVCGAGELRGLLADLPNVECRDFVQPSELPDVLLNADVLVLPSLFEPWGLVIHEAAATGMPIICSEACGAGEFFVQSTTNGFLTKTGDIRSLANAMKKFTLLPEDQIRLMGQRSYLKASQRTPNTWAACVDGIAKTFLSE